MPEQPQMTMVDLLREAFTIELHMTRRLLERIPADIPEWRPHSKSMPLGALAMHIATLPGLATACLTTPGFDVATAPPQPAGNILDTFDAKVHALNAALATTTDAELSQPWRFTAGAFVISERPRAVALLHNFFGHLSHHRAQLGTYLRLLDLPVPGVYGPSADEMPGQR